jgi:hypothetical protein
MATDGGVAKLGVSGTDTMYPNGGVSFGAWKGLTRTVAYAALSATIKNRFMQAMIDPAFDNVNPIGSYYFDTTTERLPLRGGTWYYGASAGVAALHLYNARSGVDTLLGFRPAYVG